MNRPDIYKKSVNILYNAYFNDTLQHNNCYACAIGNLVAENCGISIIRAASTIIPLRWSDGDTFWDSVHTKMQGGQHYINPHNYKGEAKRQIDSTGYTWQETAKIELAFENAPKGNSEDDWMYNGLVAVLDCLAEIHEIDSVDTDKSRFTELHLVKAKQTI